jgi:anti-sigma B factor antagonist
MELHGEVLINRDPLQLPIEVESIGDDLVLVTVHGEVDMAEAGELRAVLNDACAGPHRSVALDLRDVHFVGTSGMGVLADVHARMTDSGRRFVVLEPAEAIRRAFEMAGVPQVLTLDAPGR